MSQYIEEPPSRKYLTVSCFVVIMIVIAIGLKVYVTRFTDVAACNTLAIAGYTPEVKHGVCVLRNDTNEIVVSEIKMK